MNILFINTFNVSPHLGGTERITDTLCTEFQKTYHHNCFLAYYNDIPNKYKQTQFAKKIHLKNHRQYKNLFKFIDDNKINFIILQGQFRIAKHIKIKYQDKIKIVFAHHLFPGVEKSAFKFSYIKPHKIRLNNVLPTFIKIILFPIIKIYQQIKLPKYYNETYKYADQIVLLSHHLIQPFMQFGRITDDKKFTIIHNALSFKEFYPIEKLYEKKKNILIVSRLVENPKRILFAIKAWEYICKNSSSSDWSMTIVGTGTDEALYKKYCQKQQIRNISFEGNRDPKSYYKTASIFLMTSQLESWGLTITEAQQFGVVPIALNSYPSLSEIITNNKDGIITPDNDLQAYANAIKELMINTSLRHKLATNAIESAKRFQIDTILQQWINLIKQ